MAGIHVGTMNLWFRGLVVCSMGPLGAFPRSSGVWGFGISQFGVNVRFGGLGFRF